jgi:hypothetical protein
MNYSSINQSTAYMIECIAPSFFNIFSRGHYEKIKQFPIYNELEAYKSDI